MNEGVIQELEESITQTVQRNKIQNEKDKNIIMNLRLQLGDKTEINAL